MKTLSTICLAVFLLSPLAAQQAKPLVVACPNQCVPVRCGQGADCAIIANLFQQVQLPIVQCCEKTDSNGTVWAKVQVKGWVNVRQNNQKVLRRLMTRNHEWAVTNNCSSQNLPVMCTGQGAGHKPVACLTKCAVVAKQSPGLPKCGCMYVCFSGWAVKQCGKQVFLCDLCLK